MRYSKIKGVLTMKVFIVNMSKQDKLYRIVVAKKNKETKKVEYGVAELTEAMLKDKMMRGLRVENAGLKNGVIVGTTGSLDRFLESNRFKPVVIMVELIDSRDKTLGYRISDSQGRVKNVRAEVLIDNARAAKQRGLIAIQNGAFVSQQGVKEHIRSFSSTGYPKEIIAYRNKKPINNGIKYGENKKNIQKIKEIFNKEQIQQLLIGKERGVNIKVYANPKYSAKQMEQIRLGLQQKVNVRLFLDPEFSALQMNRLRAEIAHGFDVSSYANPKYSIAQMAQIRLGVLAGVDISLYANPDTKANEMEEIRIRLENGIWCDCESSKLDPNKIY